MLAMLLAEHGDELLADFQQFYGLDLWALMDACDFARVRALTEQLPQGARTLTAMDGACAWGVAENLLANLCDQLASLRWERAGGHGRKPKRIERPGGRSGTSATDRTVRGMSREDVMAALARPRE